MTIDWLKDRTTGQPFYPVTHEDAVIDSNGNTLSTNLGNKSDKSTTVTNVSYDSTSKKIQKTINGTTSDVVTLATVATSGTYNDLSGKPTLPEYCANVPLALEMNYIREPEVKTIKINGSTTNAASTNNCVLQYDTTNNCLKFVFN